MATIRRFLLAAVSVTSMLSGCAMLQSRATVTPVDQQFMLTAASVGVAEIDLAQLALRQSANPTVQEYARHMISDHTRVNAELQQVADTKKVVLLKAMDPANHTLYSELSKLSGAAFDREYMLAQLNIHNMGNGLYQSEAQNGQDPEVRKFAAKNLPVGVEHLQMARAIAR